MPNIILASRYLKKSSPNKLSNLIKYIGTREGVEFNNIEFDQDKPVTEKQNELIENLEKDFPEIKDLIEYEDFKSNPSAENASDLIDRIIEQNADQISGKNNFVRYMAMRPNVEKVGSHGLFSQTDDPISLNDIADEVANHKGNIWSHVLSLRREDAERLNYNNQDAFKILMRKNINALATYHKIPLDKIKWYAAFHNESHHPHIHLIVYSTDVKKGYLSDYGIKKLKSVFENDIFKDELNNLYDEQTDVRNTLRNEATEKAFKLIKDIENGACESSRVETLIMKLHEQLKTVSGKMVYGYLPKEIKNTVDEVVRELAADERIAELYQKWYELDVEKVKNYKDKIPDNVPLEDQKEFKSIKNSVIKAALSLNFTLNYTEFQIADLMTSLPDPELDDVISDSPANDEDSSDETDIIPDNDSDSDAPSTSSGESTGGISSDYVSESNNRSSHGNGSNDNTGKGAYGSSSYDENDKYYLAWNNDYKLACDFLYGKNGKDKDVNKALELFNTEAENGNVLAIYNIGHIYLKGLLGEIDNDKAHLYFENALQGFIYVEGKKDKLNAYAQYRIGKMYNSGYGTDQDYSMAAEWFHKSAIQDNKYAMYSLGSLYYYGNGVERDYNTAFHWYKNSADMDNAYAQYEVGKMYWDGQGVFINAEQSDSYFKKAFKAFLKMEYENNADDKLWYRIGHMYLKGMGTDVNVDMAKEYFLKSANSGNVHAQYALGEMALKYKNITPEEMTDVVSWLTMASDKDDSSAQYVLGKLYIDGTVIFQDVEKGISLLKQSAEHGNENAQYNLGNIFFSGDNVQQDTVEAIKWFTQAAEKENEFAAFELGKIYSSEEYIKPDLQKAEKWFRQAADADNHFAQYALAILYLKDELYNPQGAAGWLERSAAHDNDFALLKLGRMLLEGKHITKNISRAVRLIERSAAKNNSFAQYALGKLYLYGNDVEKDTEKALHYLNLSAAQDNPYAIKLLERYNSAPFSFGVALGLFQDLGRMFSGRMDMHRRMKQISADKKLLSKLNMKKLAHGIKTNNGSLKL